MTLCTIVYNATQGGKNKSSYSIWHFAEANFQMQFLLDELFCIFIEIAIYTCVIIMSYLIQITF